MAARAIRAEGGEIARLDRYELIAELAAGGMATVLLARLSGVGGFQRLFAIKRLHPHLAHEQDFVQMFLDEARLAARIHHPNVVPILEVGTSEAGYYLVMEYIEGETLARLMSASAQAGSRVQPRIVTRIILDVLAGLDAAHELRDDDNLPLNIVHRDVSPQNVMVGVQGTARITDFGVAHAATRLSSTRDGQLKGKLPYMAPEQLRGTRIDRRTDVYAAAAVLWEALTGRRLFDAEDEVVIFGRVLEGVIEPPSKVVPSLPRALDQVALRGLARDPDHRYQTAQEMAIALERAVGVAIPREVGRWVEQNAASSLKKRMERIAEIESVSSLNLQSLAVSGVAAPTPAPPSAQSLSQSGYAPASLPARPSDGYAASPAPQMQDPYSASQLSLISQTQMSALAVSQSAQPAAPRRSVVVLLAALIATVLVVSAAAALFIVLRRPSTVSSPDPAADPAGNLAAVSASSSATVEAPTASPAPVVSSAPVATVVPPAGTRPPQIGPAPTVVHTKKTAPISTPAPPTATPKANCDPPYTLDAKGVRIPKPQCL